MQLLLAGTSHHRAPIEIRERLAFSLETGRELAQRLAGPEGEAVAISTCNRTELYLAAPDVERAKTQVQSELSRLSGLTAEELSAVLYILHDQRVAQHLFRVAAGLDSLVPGEAQILGQVRSAYEQGAPGTILHRLFRQAIAAGKRVRAETTIGESPASISSAAAELVEQVFGELAGRRVLVLGAGKAAELVVASLAKRGARSVTVANRSPERAAELARRLGGQAVSLQSVGEQLRLADVVVGSTGSEGLVVARDDVAEAMRVRKGRPIFFIDIAVPRDLDPAINDLDGCYLYDIDDLDEVVRETLALRHEEAIRAEAIVAEEVELFRSWTLALDVVPAIASLRELAEQIRTTELERARGRLATLTPSERQAVESLTSQIVNKLLHLPIVKMKEAAADSDGVLYAETVRQLFGLGERER